MKRPVTITVLIMLELMLVALLGGCSTGPRPVEYGKEECAYCKMIVMDQRYGSELVTSKGKVYVFDAAECLADFLHYSPDLAGDDPMLFVTPYTQPGNLIEAGSASFLVSPSMPSPMGAFLTAFPDDSTARQYRSEKGGTVHSWEDVRENIRSIRLRVNEEFRQLPEQ